ncbi:MAG: glycosyl hydrolase [bacterium]
MQKNIKKSVLFFCLIVIINAVSISLSAQSTNNSIETLSSVFLNPPAKSKPYVWWHWMGPNFSKAGITKDLEAMKEIGIGGATIFNIASAVQESHFPILNNPWPDQTYRSPAYWDAIKHAANEAKRLGLELGLHNTAGYSTTGGPWVTEEKAMQKLVWSKVQEEGGKTISLELQKPELPIFYGWGSTQQRASFYKDVAVLAVPVSEKVELKEIIDLSKNMNANGTLNWDAPTGKWIIYRIGHAPTMANPHPLPDDIIGKSLEVDKMSAEQNVFHWNTVIEPLKKHLPEHMGNSFKHLLIDSYEADAQNWTPGFRQEFIKRKGYDPIPWLITLDKDTAGRSIAITSKEHNDRFNWDFNDVIAQLFYENSWTLGKKMINDAKLDLQFEPYFGPFDVAQGAALADIPMGEFWTHWVGMTKIISPAARAAGKAIVGAEAFTGSPANSQYTEDPAFLKTTANRAFSAGINRLILHTWVHQPFDDKYQPGMSMGWWGTHFGRHQTWVKPGKAFFAYLSRSQALLQYGLQASDILSLEKSDDESSDVISVFDFLKQNIKVINGKIVLESGRQYPILVLPNSTSILPEVIKKISALVFEGASVVGNKPERSYGLKNYPSSDKLLNEFAKKLWSDNAQTSYGKGFMFTSLKDALQKINLSPDVRIEKADSAHLISTIHRKGAEADVYFIANLYEKPQQLVASFRIKGMQPEIWQAEDGTITNAPIWKEENGRTIVHLNLNDFQSAFVVFRKPVSTQLHAVHIEADNSKARLETRQRQSQQYAITADQATKIMVTYSNGENKMIEITAPKEENITGNWNITFNPKLDKSFSATFPALKDFSESNDPRIKYFAGSATYRISFSHKEAKITTSNQYLLDLGTMNDIASIKLNGIDLGVTWYPPYVIDITKAIKSGDNQLEITVTNNWANRLIGDEKEPADFEWGADRGELGRAMKSFPDWFVNNKPRPSTGRKSFVLWYYYRTDSQLKPAGLVGPVKLIKRESKEL